MRSLVRTRRFRALEKRYLPEKLEDVRLIWGSEEDGSAYGIDLVGQGEARRSIPWRQDDETRPEGMPPPPPDYWERKTEQEQRRVPIEEPSPEKARAVRRVEEANEPDPVMRDHRKKFEKPKKGTPWDGKHELATAARTGRRALRHTDGGERWPAREAMGDGL